MNAQEIFEHMQREAAVLAYVSFPECSVCTSLRPKIEQLVSEYDTVDFLYVDSHKHPSVSGQWLVFAAPTLILFQQGREVKRWSRVFSVDEVRLVLDQME
mgnify:FL=1